MRGAKYGARSKEYLSCDAAANIKEKHRNGGRGVQHRGRRCNVAGMRLLLDAGRRIYCIFHVHNEPILRSSNPISQWPFGDAAAAATLVTAAVRQCRKG